MVTRRVTRRWRDMLRPLYHRLQRNRVLRRLWFFGTRQYCPICASYLRQFAAHPSDPARKWDALCPVCGSKSPHRRAWLVLESLLADASLDAPQFLHIAPEPHLAARLSRCEIQYLSGDIQRGKGHMELDITCMPFEDKTIDFIYCCHVLMMLGSMQDVTEAIRECYRVLRTGGKCIIENPVGRGHTVDMSVGSPEDRANRWYHSDVMRMFGENDYWDLFTSVGFTIQWVPLSKLKTTHRNRNMMLYADSVAVLTKS